MPASAPPLAADLPSCPQPVSNPCLPPSGTIQKALEVIDKAGRLKGLHLLHEVIGARPRPNWRFHHGRRQGHTAG